MSSSVWEHLKQEKYILSTLEQDIEYYGELIGQLRMHPEDKPRLFLAPFAIPVDYGDPSDHTISIGQIDTNKLLTFLDVVMNDLHEQHEELQKEYDELKEQHRQEVMGNGSQASD